MRELEIRAEIRSIFKQIDIEDTEVENTIVDFFLSLRRKELEGLRGEVQMRAQVLTGHGKLPSKLEIEEQVKYNSRKSDHIYHEVAGKLLGYLDILSLIEEKI